ncbi:uncharacterized protein LOC100185327 [Ciona intestinalis]
MGNKCFILVSTLVLTSVLVILFRDEVYEEIYRIDRQIECVNGGRWNNKHNMCICNYTWAGRDCSIWRHHQCYFDYGRDYRGMLSTTRSGLRCALWTTDHNNDLYPLGERGIDTHNFCRNPDNEPTGIWCYVDGEQYMDFCNATICPDEYKIMPNITLGEDESTENPTVRFLFGPLISGVCGGVVGLLILSGIAEYLRRKEYFQRRRKRKKIKSSASGVNNNDDTDLYKELGVTRPLGGVITVNVDTGEQRRHSAGNTTSEDGRSRSSKEKSISGMNIPRGYSATTKQNPDRNAEVDKKNNKVVGKEIKYGESNERVGETENLKQMDENDVGSTTDKNINKKISKKRTNSGSRSVGRENQAFINSEKTGEPELPKLEKIDESSSHSSYVGLSSERSREKSTVPPRRTTDKEGRRSKSYSASDSPRTERRRPREDRIHPRSEGVQRNAEKGPDLPERSSRHESRTRDRRRGRYHTGDRDRSQKRTRSESSRQETEYRGDKRNTRSDKAEKNDSRERRKSNRKLTSRNERSSRTSNSSRRSKSSKREHDYGAGVVVEYV